MRVVRHPREATGATALAVGSFDGVHLGHAALIGRLARQARAHGLESAVLTFEPLPREFFSPATAPPRLTSMRERLEQLRRLGVDRVFLQRFDARFASVQARDFERLLREAYGARRVLVGQDFRYGARRAGDVASLVEAGRREGYEVELLPAVTEGGERVSSTRARAALASGDLGLAAQLLGRPYAITGRVVHGAKRGRALGFPTANVRLGRPRAALRGVFAVKCFGAATRGLEGVASLGVNPAVTEGGKATLEAFLFDFSGDLYGRRLTLEFLEKLRDEAHFASLDELAAQIRRDCDAARGFFASAGNR
jgi:riboflavin kinase/FMN adenylyltransferase